MMRVTRVASAVFMAAAGLSVPTGVSAGEIALTLTAQDITIVGELLTFENETYVVATETGTIHVPAVMATCAGDDCVFVTAAQGATG